jgi:hypothetical protein
VGHSDIQDKRDWNMGFRSLDFFLKLFQLRGGEGGRRMGLRICTNAVFPCTAPYRARPINAKYYKKTEHKNTNKKYTMPEI